MLKLFLLKHLCWTKTESKLGGHTGKGGVARRLIDSVSGQKGKDNLFLGFSIQHIGEWPVPSS